MTTALDMMGDMELEIARLTSERDRWQRATQEQQREVGRLHLDLARLTHDAASECGRLRDEVKAWQTYVNPLPILDCECGACVYLRRKQAEVTP